MKLFLLTFLFLSACAKPMDSNGCATIVQNRAQTRASNNDIYVLCSEENNDPYAVIQILENVMEISE